MNRYYFLASLLPSLNMGTPPEFPFWEFKELCMQNLSPRDLEQTQVIRGYIDLKNLRPFWQQKELDPHGNYNHKEIEEHLLLEEGFPDYVFEFLKEYEKLEEKFEFFPVLLARFFQEEIEKSKGFLKDFLIFEREWRLVMLAMRAKIYKRDLAWELQHEDPQEILVAQILAQKDAENFSPPEGYEDLKEIFSEFRQDPLKLHWELANWRIKKIADLPQRGTFSIDRILCYLAQLILAENWVKLNHEQGMNVVQNIMKEQEG
ncbi:MAG: hypothetical protein S4CHLAM7_02350 [Chlamydiae bacterium]|nr:hypothetical protein [Chlamydiota bacterium]